MREHRPKTTWPETNAGTVQIDADEPVVHLDDMTVGDKTAIEIVVPALHTDPSLSALSGRTDTSGLTAGQTPSGSFHQGSNCHAVSTLSSAFLGTEIVHLQTSQGQLCQAKLQSGGRRRSGYCALATGESHGVVGYFALCNTSPMRCCVLFMC